MKKRYAIGITGASGSAYGIRITEALAASDCELHLIVSDHGRQVMEWESGLSLPVWIERLSRGATANIRHHRSDDLFAPPASGSYLLDGMIVAPCSMAAAAAVAAGNGGDLIRRAADVQIKERRRLVLVVRETPLSVIHLRNLLALSEAGVIILPAAPAFYHKPRTVEDLVNFIAGRALSAVGVANDLCPEWSGGDHTDSCLV